MLERRKREGGRRERESRDLLLVYSPKAHNSKGKIGKLGVYSASKHAAWAAAKWGLRPSSTAFPAIWMGMWIRREQQGLEPIIWHRMMTLRATTWFIVPQHWKNRAWFCFVFAIFLLQNEGLFSYVYPSVNNFGDLTNHFWNFNSPLPLLSYGWTKVSQENKDEVI